MPIRRSHPFSSPDLASPLWGTAGAFASACVGALAVYACAVEPFRFQLTRPVLTIPRLPAALDGLTILLLADAHISRDGRREKRLRAFLQRFAEREGAPPDLVVWAGDMINEKRGISLGVDMTRFVRDLFPQTPAFAILGNGEHKINEKQRRQFVGGLRSLGVSVLRNSRQTITLRGETFTVAGVDDPYYGFADLEATLRGAPDPHEHFTLLLAHSPQFALIAARAGIAVMLSGHTHGGQIRIPFYGPFKSQNALGRRMDQGLFDRARVLETTGRDQHSDMVTYVTRGIGVAPAPKIRCATPRFHCRPEIALLTLRCPSEAEDSEGVAVP